MLADPMAVSGLVAVVVLSFVLCASEYLYAIAFVSPTTGKVVSTGIPTELIRGDLFYWQSLQGAIVLAAAPVAVVFNLLFRLHKSHTPHSISATDFVVRPSRARRTEEVRELERRRRYGSAPGGKWGCLAPSDGRSLNQPRTGPPSGLKRPLWGIRHFGSDMIMEVWTYLVRPWVAYTVLRSEHSRPNRRRAQAGNPVTHGRAAHAGQEECRFDGEHVQEQPGALAARTERRVPHPNSR
ncbi:hypothetical protein [Dactylosporangium sp. NPDC051484]|uniref:hypothetical protein n=1 Tax=Dactylosporangium sp. NPDC051484 TaxID=3154942 RepID=UPI00344EDCAA